jgi:glycosyltransferase involved in cell wall biosynthesis
MKSIMLYNASWSSFGGGEKYLCAAADELSRDESLDVRMLMDDPGITRERLRTYFNLPLERARLETCTRSEVGHRLRSTDACIIMSNFVPFGRPAPVTVYVLQIPYPPLTARMIAADAASGRFREAAKNVLRRRLMSDARRSQGVIVYSRFVAGVLAANHGVNATVIHPPIDDFASTGPKTHSILSVGRFFVGPYNDKRYDILIDAFKHLCDRNLNQDFTYWIVGSASDDPATGAHIDSLRARAAGYPITFVVNASYDSVRTMYGRASIFWHAAGFGVDERARPDRAEHFGMSTVEAMSAACVPVVVRKGGQKEIVSHAESGYLWESPEELIEHTAALIASPERLRAVQPRARERSLAYDRSHFSDSLRTFIRGLGLIA